MATRSGLWSDRVNNIFGINVAHHGGESPIAYLQRAAEGIEEVENDAIEFHEELLKEMRKHTRLLQDIKKNTKQTESSLGDLLSAGLGFRMGRGMARGGGRASGGGRSTRGTRGVRSPQSSSRLDSRPAAYSAPSQARVGTGQAGPLPRGSSGVPSVQRMGTPTTNATNTSHLARWTNNFSTGLQNSLNGTLRTIQSAGQNFGRNVTNATSWLGSTALNAGRSATGYATRAGQSVGAGLRTGGRVIGSVATGAARVAGPLGLGVMGYDAANGMMNPEQYGGGTGLSQRVRSGGAAVASGAYNTADFLSFGMLGKLMNDPSAAANQATDNFLTRWMSPQTQRSVSNWDNALWGALTMGPQLMRGGLSGSFGQARTVPGFDANDPVNQAAAAALGRLGYQLSQKSLMGHLSDAGSLMQSLNSRGAAGATVAGVNAPGVIQLDEIVVPSRRDPLPATSPSSSGQMGWWGRTMTGLTAQFGAATNAISALAEGGFPMHKLQEMGYEFGKGIAERFGAKDFKDLIANAVFGESFDWAGNMAGNAVPNHSATDSYLAPANMPFSNGNAPVPGQQQTADFLSGRSRGIINSPGALANQAMGGTISALVPNNTPLPGGGFAGSARSLDGITQVNRRPGGGFAGGTGGATGELISSGEGGYGSYNRGNAGDSRGTIDFSTMSLNEIQRRQSLAPGDPNRLFAVGKYQVIPQTMRDAMNALGLTGEEMLTNDLQERIYREHLIAGKRPDIKNYVTGVNDNLAAAQLAGAQEFASIADPRTGRSFYSDRGNNASSITADQFAQSLQAERAQYQRNIAAGMSPEQAWASLSGGTPTTALSQNLLQPGSTLKPLAFGTGQGVSNVVQNQAGATNRKNPIQDLLQDNISQVLLQTLGPEFRAEVYSGSQTGPGASRPRGASDRHDHGGAADLKIYGPDGQQITQEQYATFAQGYLAQKLGGIGLQMNGGGIHVDRHTDKAPYWTYDNKGGIPVGRTAGALVQQGLAGTHPAYRYTVEEARAMMEGGVAPVRVNAEAYRPDTGLASITGRGGSRGTEASFVGRRRGGADLEGLGLPVTSPGTAHGRQQDIVRVGEAIGRAVVESQPRSPVPSFNEASVASAAVTGNVPAPTPAQRGGRNGVRESTANTPAPTPSPREIAHTDELSMLMANSSMMA